MTKFEFKKKYGQNFLQNKDVIEKIVSSVNPGENDLIIEIGPGAGAITNELKRYHSYLIAFEIDTDTKKYLLPLEDEKTKIVYEDFLTVDISKYTDSIDYNKIYIIGNLPYYITTPIIEHIIESNIDSESLTIMVQKEVGDRFLAGPHSKDYGYMTVLLNYWYNLERVVNVSKKDFYPVPKVDSVVLKMNKKERRSLDYSKFIKLLKDSFQFKRKTISNNLRSYDLKKVEQVLQKHDKTLQARAEELDLETFIDLSKI